jgi:hypothetical protein
MAAPESNTEESLKRTDEQLKALKRQVSGIPHSLHTAAPAKPEADEKEPKVEQSKAAEQPKK